MVVRTMEKLYFVFYFLLWISIAFCISDLDDIQNACKERCQSNLIQSIGGNLFCDEDCGVLQCQNGCTKISSALSSNCLKACTPSATQETKEAEARTQKQNCIRGCNVALVIYVNHIKGQLEPLLKPDLIRETKNYSSIVLQWNGKILADVKYMIQVRMMDIHQLSSDWQMYNHSRFLPNGKIAIFNLHPYVTYRFKVIAVIIPLPQHVAESPETVPITTLAHGVPASAPKITSMSAPSPSVISISWTPPQFSNGPLVGYRINVNPQNHPTLKSTTKDLLGGATSWTVGQLQPSQHYMITVSAWNAAGEGPADSSTITTPNPGNLSIHETPYLILGSANKVLKQNLMDVIHSVPDTIHNEENQSIKVTGVGIHIRRQVILVSDSSGKVRLTSITGDYREDNLYASLLEPTAISIDWLSDWVYVASRNRIYRCAMNRDACIIVVDGLQSTPGDVKVDPVNGFLYFTQFGEDKGLYRIDLGNIGKKRPVPPSQLVFTNDLSSFVIDFDNVRLYYPNSTENTMMSVFVDGTDSKDIREKVLQPNFYHILSMANYKGLFYWTNGTKVLREEFDPGFRKYRHNELLFFDDYYRGFNLYHPSAQPTPVPHMSPQNVQAVFTSHSVKVKWQAPPLLQYQGTGAWQDWTYELQLHESLEPGTTQQYFNGTVRKMTIPKLLPDTKYSLRIRALSEAGYGPWSEYFIGRTLKDDKIPVRVLMATSGAIIESDITQNMDKTVVGFVSNATDISWHKDKLLWTSSSGILSVYDRATRWRYSIQHVNYAACVAYDWLGKKIFWSEPQQGVIKRTDINGLSSDFISQAAARDMVIDSIAGRIYWATTNSIESSFLNGEDHIEIFSVPYFSGKQVISVALNFDMKKVLWYLKSFEQQDLFMADLISGEGTNVGDVIATVRPVGDFRSISRLSGLQYYSHRLFWMDQASALVVGNMECNYTSVISPRNVSVTAFAVMHPSMHGYPAGLNEKSLRVIPMPMKPSSVKVSGPWSSFNLTWNQALEVNHGKVFYKVYVQIAKHSTHIVTSKTWHPIEGLSPYSLMSISIQPYTYWGYADPTRVSIRSPMSVPTQPLTPRVYITQRKNATTSKLLLAADFRWSAPIIISGILHHHIVYHWVEGYASSPQHVQASGIARHFILNNLVANKTYYFQVKACTVVGCGPKSDIVSAVTDSVNPVPRLLIATTSSVRLSEMDGQLNSTVLLQRISPSAMAFLAQDERTFWIEQTNALYVSQASKQTSLMDLNGTGKDLSMDWISRTLYVVEEDNRIRNRIMGYHVDQDTYELILIRSKSVGSIVSDPYTSSLFWTENDSKGQGHIFHSDTNGNDIVDLIGGKRLDERRKKRADPRCNCARQVNVSPVITMDYSAKGDMNILFSDEDSYSIMASDEMGCRCRVLYSATPGDSQGLPPDLLAVDHLRVYWYNKSEQKLYSVNKNTGADFLKQSIRDVQDIVAYGAHLQPLPDSACLDPGPYNTSVTSERIGNVSITLKLNEMKRPPHCAGISIPQDKYTVYYTKQPSTSVVGEHIDCSIEANHCKTLETYEREITVENLEPYTDYMLQVAVSNYYTEYLAEALGPATVYRTKEGVPSSARNVTAIVLKPVEIQVEWFAPANPRGPLENISYVIKWSTLTSAGLYLEGQTDTSAVRQMESGKFYTYLKSLQPKHTYSIKVLSFDSSRTLYSESAPVRTKTFDTPGVLTLLQSFPSSLRLIWTSPADNSVTRHSYQYAKVTSGELLWDLHDGMPQSTENNTEYEVDFTYLKPDTDYVFQVKALYRSTPFSLYVWPNDRRYTFRTMTDVPDEPFPPKVHQLKSGTYEVVWTQPEDNGEPVNHYLLEYSFPDSNEWHSACNGSSMRWVVDDETLQPRHRYIFRVAAENDNGWSPFSDNSSVFLAPSALMKNVVTEEVGIAIAVSISFIIIVIIIVITGICICTKRRQHERKKTREFIAVYQVPDMELATLRELPHTAVQQSNTLYGISYVPTAEDIASLPHFHRDQLNLTKFLGSGAFGEVFMGVAKNILCYDSGETKVAVKTLRKSATEIEKEEFLKEALLMSNFHHEHILGLLGVCLDNDPQFLILELMEGSDLLSFLRNCRATSSSPGKLLLPDLVQICVHVARGCQYLEEMHFVHRDLAARNCLVSSVNPCEMVIKIGDFGLARDIYKNDYYRKEGEGLLPVRWMSPESLVDGVFTTLSDIWAFGVLMWEVLTLGQQPYPARTNIEVLHFVRAGGKLERPEKCPDDIYELMQKCWSFSPEDRPTFSFLLQRLEQYKDKCDNMTADEIAQSSPTALDAQPRVTSSSSSTNTDFYFGLANLAFDDEVVASDTSEDEDVGPETMFTHPSCPHRRREGGSVRLTPTSKRRRLMTLLGGAEANEKLTVDLPRQMKRTISLDSKHSSASDDPHISYSQVQFMREREYDEMGYLKPRTKDIPKYLELINDPIHGGMQPVNERLNSPSESVSSSNSQRSVQYAAMNRNNGPSSPSSANFPLIQFSDSNGNADYTRPVRTNPGKPPPYQVAKEISLRTKGNNPLRSCKNDASHTDRDLYSRPLISGQLSNSSNESGYYCVECYNNRSPPHRNDKGVPNYERVDEGRMESPLPNYAVWSNNNIGHGCPGEVSNANKDLLVFPPEYVNVSNHGGRTSRNQVYPENGAAFAGFEISQASLV